MIKLIATDMDGTLLTNDKVLTNETARLIKRLKHYGIEFLPVTGRSFASAAMFYHLHGIQTDMINLNGAAYTLANGERAEEIPIPPADVLEIVDYLDRENIRHTIVARDNYYNSDPHSYCVWARHALEAMLKERERENAAFRQGLDTETYLRYLKMRSDLDLANEPHLMKIMVFFKDQNSKADFLKQFGNSAKLTFTASGSDNVEITSSKVNKGESLLRWAAKRGIQANEILAFGDSYNDLSMLEVIPNSYAMANADEAIKEIAKFQAPSNQEDGVAQIIKKVALGE